MRTNYTKIENVEPDNYIINTLADLLSGKIGKLTNIHQYFFQKSVTKNEDVKNLLLDILKGEYKHATLLSDAIIEFGGVPYLCNQFNHFFTTKYVDYETNEIDFLENNIKTLKCIIDNYEKIIASLKNEDLKKLLTEIKEDEMENLTLFEKQLELINKKRN